MTQPQLIVSAMRAGGREYIERPTTTTDLLEAFVRLTSTAQARRENSRGKVFTIVNAKGGSGATTVAVNLALALESIHHSTRLVDLAPLGHCALHLNLKPPSAFDAIANLHRLDSSCSTAFMARHNSGLQVLAGAATPTAIEPSASDFARLFDTMVGSFHYIVVDASSRLDSATRLVRQLVGESPAHRPRDVAPSGARAESPSTSARAARATVRIGVESLSQVRALTKRRPKPPSARRCCGGFPINTSRFPRPSIAASP